MERIEELVGVFLRQRYGLSLIDSCGTLRAGLLEETEQIASNLFVSEDAVEIAHRDKYDLLLTSFMCRICGLMYLNPRPTVAGYDRIYSEGGTKSGVYHGSLGFENPAFSTVAATKREDPPKVGGKTKPAGGEGEEGRSSKAAAKAKGAGREQVELGQSRLAHHGADPGEWCEMRVW